MLACKYLTSFGAVLALMAQHGHLTVRETAHKGGESNGSATAALQSL